mgnify:CR=1 FL=1
MGNGLLAIGAGIAVLTGIGAGVSMGLATGKSRSGRQHPLDHDARSGSGGIDCNLRLRHRSDDHVPAQIKTKEAQKHGWIIRNR